MKRILGTCLLIAGMVAALSGCEVNQISWANHFYIVSNSCATARLPAGGTALSNGVGYIGTPGTLASTRVDLLNTYYGDLTHDGIQDAVVFLNCHDTTGGNANGSEIQVFTRDAKPVERLVAPNKYPGGSFPPYFAYNQIRIVDNVLYTGVEGYLPRDSHAGPSAYDVYRWDWNGHGFTPVDVSTTMTLAGAKLTLPAGWVAEELMPTAHSQPVAPVWCLMPHSAPMPPSTDAPGCTIDFLAVSAATTPPNTWVDLPGGLVGNPEFCAAPQPQTVSLLGYQDSTFGARAASYRHWLYACGDGSRWPIEQYVANNAPGFILYSSHATPAVHAVLTEIAKTAELPTVSASLRLSDFGIVRSLNTIAGGFHITLDRVVLGTASLINDSTQTYAYNVATGALLHGQTMHVGDTVLLNTNGSAVTTAEVMPKVPAYELP